jgi:hypothetical protein
MRVKFDVEVTSKTNAMNELVFTAAVAPGYGYSIFAAPGVGKSKAVAMSRLRENLLGSLEREGIHSIEQEELVIDLG